MGAGPSYSIFFAQGQGVRFWGGLNFTGEREHRYAYTLAHFGEVDWNVKSGRWAVVFGYSEHNFFPSFERKGYTAQGTFYYFKTKEYDKNIYSNITVKYRLVNGVRNKLDVSTGGYMRWRRMQLISYFPYFENRSIPRGTAITVEDEGITKTNVEAGFPFNIDYLHTLGTDDRAAIGIRLNVNYTQSVRQWEHVAAQLFLKVKLK